ncbi:MAG: GIY-YIG nuclease family protein [Candidatus Omnitrophota bacterium]|nr:GIY-YIG nuclease family protein [Candidatus Omnitrophota bacterium]
MYWVYILRSKKDNRHYTGYTNNLERRLEDHNREKSASVKYRGPFEIVHYEKYSTRPEAVLREKQIKSYKGGEAFKKLLNNLTPSSSLA